MVTASGRETRYLQRPFQFLVLLHDADLIPVIRVTQSVINPAALLSFGSMPRRKQAKTFASSPSSVLQSGPSSRAYSPA